jgi:hypothetical protein
MPRSRSVWGLIALTIAVVGGAAAPPAGADVLNTYERLAERDLPRAPLVPTTVPEDLQPIGAALESLSTRRRSAYGLRLSREGGPTTAAVIALVGGDYSSIAQARRDFVRRQGFTARATRIRGHAGLALTRREPRQRALVWREGGVVYWMGTGTTRTISAGELRATATGLEPLGAQFSGSGPDPDLETSAVLVTTRGTVTGEFSWASNCTAAGGNPGSPYAGSADVTLLPTSGGRFAIDLAARDTGSVRWSGTISGVVAADAVTLTIRATAAPDGLTCDTGVVQVRLTRRTPG